jgi:S1-C subfamily serine protease
MVHRIIANGPADKAGFLKGDIILEFDGALVADTNDLRLKSSLAGIGKQVKVKVRRGTSDLLLNLVLARSPHE